MSKRRGTGRRIDVRAEAEEALREYRDLYLVEVGDNLVVRGQFPVADERGTIDRFAVEIVIDPRNPNNLPRVWEVAGRIPRTPDRHINSGSGDACTVVPGDWLMRRPDSSLRSFLAGPVRNFFIAQALVERDQPWPMGERSHGDPGVMEALEELTGFSGEKAVNAALNLLRSQWIGSHRACPCGSGRMLRACHLPRIRLAQERVSAAGRAALHRMAKLPRRKGAPVDFIAKWKQAGVYV